jgi:hypothetical protein
MPGCGATFDENGVAQTACFVAVCGFSSVNLTQNRRPP